MMIKTNSCSLSSQKPQTYAIWRPLEMLYSLTIPPTSHSVCIHCISVEDFDCRELCEGMLCLLGYFIILWEKKKYTLHAIFVQSELFIEKTFRVFFSMQEANFCSFICHFGPLILRYFFNGFHNFEWDFHL